MLKLRDGCGDANCAEGCGDQGARKKTTCAEIVLKVAAIQGGEKRHVLKLRNRWRRHRKRKKNDTWPNCAEGGGDQGARKQRNVLNFRKDCGDRGEEAETRRNYAMNVAIQGGGEACSNCAEGCGGQGARTNRNLLKLPKKQDLDVCV